MKLLCLCILAALAFVSTDAAISAETAEIDPNRPNGCIWTNQRTKVKVFHANGSSWKIGPCSRATCKNENGNFIVLKESCGVIAVEPPCRLTEVDPTKIYPECCPKPICS